MGQDKLFCVGVSEERKDGVSKAAGTALYIDDYSYGGMLHAAAVRSPRPRIRIKNIDCAAAARTPGFVCLVTHKDIPGKNAWPVVLEDHPYFPEAEAKFAGETIALAVAETPEAAREAAAKVVIKYDELPFIDDPLASLEKNALKLHGEDNIFSKYVIKRGDVDEAFKKADVVVEGIFTTNYQEHAYLETQGVIAFPGGDGTMTVYGSMQCPFYVVDAVAQALGTAHNQVRIVQRVTGGGFGGKEDVPALVASHAAIAAAKTGRPVKLVYNREEDMIAMSKRHPSWTKIAYAATKDGVITGCRVKYVLDGGAYSTLSPIVLWRGTVHAAGPYRMDAVAIETYAVATNKVPCGAYRGFGQPQICFANESLIDELALKLGMDPFEFRAKNLLREGDITATGQKVKGSYGLEEVLGAAKTKSGWDAKRRAGAGEGDIRKGIGVSVNFYGVGLGARGKYLDRAGALVTVNKDASVLAAIGNTEMGQGAFTVIAQICAETLNAPYSCVRLCEVDTSKVPDSGPTVASRTTLMSGNAAINACMPIRENIFSAAKDLLAAQGADTASGFTASGGEFTCGGVKVTFAQAVAECWKRRLKMSEQGWYKAPETTFDMNTGQGEPYVAYSYSANVAEVAVDIRTGQVKLETLTCAHDMGKAVNPALAEGQIHGGAMQGVGYALYENLVYKNGIMQNPNLADYVLPSTRETPRFNVSIIERGYDAGPYKAKGFGETPLIGPAPAIANAVRHATGVRISRLPLIPETVWKALNKKD